MREPIGWLVVFAALALALIGANRLVERRWKAGPPVVADGGA